MEKNIILITGASSGIGKKTAMTLAKQGHQLIIHGRDTDKTKSVFNDIIAATGIYLATSPEVDGKTGGFYGNCRELKVKQKLISTDSQQKIWDYCTKISEKYLK